MAARPQVRPNIVAAISDILHKGYFLRSEAQSRHLASQMPYLSVAARPLDYARGDKKDLFRHKT